MASPKGDITLPLHPNKQRDKRPFISVCEFQDPLRQAVQGRTPRLPAGRGWTEIPIPRACLKIGDVSSSEGFWASGKQFFRRNPGGLQGKIAPSRGQKTRRLGMLTCFKQALEHPGRHKTISGRNVRKGSPYSYERCQPPYMSTNGSEDRPLRGAPQKRSFCGERKNKWSGADVPRRETDRSEICSAAGSRPVSFSVEKETGLDPAAGATNPLRRDAGPQRESLPPPQGGCQPLKSGCSRSPGQRGGRPPGGR